jgi:hypothetical protein
MRTEAQRLYGAMPCRARVTCVAVARQCTKTMSYDPTVPGGQNFLDRVSNTNTRVARTCTHEGQNTWLPRQRQRGSSRNQRHGGWIRAADLRPVKSPK